MENKRFTIDERLETIVAKHSDSQLVGLRNSLKARGCIDPIVVWGDIIWDGTSRYRICNELCIEFEVKYVEFRNLAEAAKERIKHHQNRRQLNPTNRIDAALNLFEGELAEQAKENQINGARKGGLGKSDENDSEIEGDNRIWVNSIIAQLAESNEAYVSFIRKLRKNAENNETKAKGMLLKLRRGEIGINSAKKSYEPKSKTSSKKESKGKSKKTPKSLLEQYDADKWGMEFALKEMNYDKLKDSIVENEQQDDVINPDFIFKKVSEYCEEDKSYGLVAALAPLFEMNYRIGYIKGFDEQSEDGIQAEFSNREFQLHSKFRQWMQFQDEENEVKGNVGERDSVE